MLQCLPNLLHGSVTRDQSLRALDIVDLLRLSAAVDRSAGPLLLRVVAVADIGARARVEVAAVINRVVEGAKVRSEEAPKLVASAKSVTVMHTDVGLPTDVYPGRSSWRS